MSDHSPVFYAILQTTLQKANPSGLPSNLVLQNFSMPDDPVTVASALTWATIQSGYAYTTGQRVITPNPGSYAATVPLGALWALRVGAQIPAGATVSLSVAVGGGTAVATSFVDPAQVLAQADCWSWTAAYDWGPPSLAPFAVPASWPDPAAHWLGPSGQPVAPGQWLLRHAVWVATGGTYTATVATTGAVTLWVDGAAWTSATAGTASTASRALAPGWHALTVTGLTTGATPTASAVLLTIASATGVILEDGQASPAVGLTWETAGIVAPGWGPVQTQTDCRWQWALVPASALTSDQSTLTLATTANSAGVSPLLTDIWAVSVAPWRWDAGGAYDVPSGSIASSRTLWPMMSSPSPTTTPPRTVIPLNA